jgi:tetratricopeptide (TPR) repeat protein/tRNA A-37 threonylcarbamoyl transferase component Bud32
MRFNCPLCHNPIEIAHTNTGEELECPVCGSSFRLETALASTLAQAAESKRQIGRFELRAHLGTGAFGSVHKAHDPKLDRFVAIKIPRLTNIEGTESLARFFREAQSNAQLRHPAIVPVYEVDQQDGTPYLVSEFVEGMTMADWLTGRRPAPREAANLIAMLAHALHYAHKQGVIHRDVKPSNIMMATDGTPKIMDFGLAKREAGQTTVTEDGQVLGTPAYMSPEQARGEGHQVDGRSDVYSLGVILYQMLTGELPFRGNTRMLLHQVLTEEPRAPRSLNHHIPRDLETICLHAMAKDPKRRYATAGALAEDLERFLGGESIRARPVGRVERSWQWSKRNPAVSGLAAAVVVCLLAGTTFSSLYAIDARREKKRADDKAEKATAAEAAARRQELRAKEYFQLARQEVDDNYTRVSEDVLLNEPNMEPLRRQLLFRANEFYQRFVQEAADDQDVKAELGMTFLRIGQITGEIGAENQGSRKSKETAIQSVNQAIGILGAEEPKHLESLALCYHQLGILLRDIGKFPEAKEQLLKAADLWQRLAETPSQRMNLVRTQRVLGNVFYLLGKNDEAKACFQKARELVDKIPEEKLGEAERTRLMREVATTYGNLANVCAPKEAEGLHREAEKLFLQLVNANPHVSQYRFDYARTLWNLGGTYFELDGARQAKPWFEKARAELEQLYSNHTANFLYQFRLLQMYHYLAQTYVEVGQLEDGKDLYSKRAFPLCEQLVKDAPPEQLVEVALCCSDYANLVLVQNPELAKLLFEKSLAALDRVAAAKDLGKGLQLRIKETLATAHAGHALTLSRAKDYQGAIEEADRAMHCELPADLVNLARVYAISSQGFAGGQKDGYLRRAIELLGKAGKEGLSSLADKDFDAVRSLPDFQALKPKKTTR